MNTVIFNNQHYTPSKILCVGRNYVDHAKELGNAVPSDIVLFSKPNSAIASTLHASHLNETLHFEAEISLLIEGGQYRALALGLDLTKRTTQTSLKNAGLPWEKAKAFDGAAVFSEFVPLPSSLDDLHIELKINGEIRQSGAVEQMLFKPDTVLQECSAFMTLYDGDIIMTGTPSGVGEIHSGDFFEGKITHGKGVLVKASWTAE